MTEIKAETQTIRSLLEKVKYRIDYYQREFQWGEKQVTELISDLVSKFQEEYEDGHKWKHVEGYSRYFLGSIIINKRENERYIIDGQQRLTSLTLFLIFLNNLQKELKSEGKIPSDKKLISLDTLIFSSKFGGDSFNIAIEERRPCMEALYAGKANNRVQSVDEKILSADDFVKKYALEKSAEISVRKLYECYQTIDANFTEDLRRDEVLLYFIEWLIERVNLVSMKTPSEEDAYSIFESMNDRGLSLSPTDMLKSLLLSNVAEDKREVVNKFWKERIRDLNYLENEAASDFFKAWLRSQYATNIRERGPSAKRENFDLIGTEFHRWVGRSESEIGLKDEESYLQFIMIDFKFYSEQYMRLLKASNLESLGTPEAEGLEHVCYNARNGFALQYMLLLAPLRPEDTSEEITKKIQVTARYIDILLTWRLWNSRQITSPVMHYAMFLVMKDIRAYRDRSASDLGKFLCTKLQELKEKEDTFDLKDVSSQSEGLFLKGNNRKVLHRILARMTDFVEMQSGTSSRFKEFMGGEIMVVDGKDGKRKKKKIVYELEHIWAYKYYENHEKEFSDRAEFLKHRDKFGGLLLLPKSVNASLKDKPYEEKLEQYFGQNFLAKTLHPNCYNNEPDFNRLCENTGLKFESIKDFKKESIDERWELYREIAKLVWNPKILLEVTEEPSD